MDILEPAIATRVIFSLGITNLMTGVLVLLSCRCIPGLRITGRLMKYRRYQRFYKYHCYYWWTFWASVMVHAIFAIAFIGIPF